VIRREGVAAHRRWRRLGVGAVAFLLVLSLGGAVAYIHLNGNIRTVPVDIDGPRPASQASRDVLLIGSDSREGDSAGFQGVGSDAVAGARSDTTVLMHLPRGGGKALLISFPRDLWVELPSCKRPGRTPSVASMGRFNKAFSIGGASCTAALVESLTGTRVDDYVQVDFASFQRIVDALGGVPYCTPVALEDPFVPRRGDKAGYGTGLSLPAGETTLNGDQALALVRARYGIGDGGDLGRIQRQQQFLGAVVRRATSTKLLLNPIRLGRFLDSATKSITTGGMKLGGLRELAGSVKNLAPGKVTFLTVPTTPRSDGATLALAPAATTLFAALRNDAPVPGGSPTAPAVTVPVAPSLVRVRVLNGTGESGVAHKAATDLEALGFVVVEVTNADSQDYEETVVRHGPSRVESGITLRSAVPHSTQQFDGSLTKTLELVVGRNYQGVVPVRVRAVPASPSSVPLTAADDPCD
jgi:LCP family protein required for cell wall assembly